MITKENPGQGGPGMGKNMIAEQTKHASKTSQSQGILRISVDDVLEGLSEATRFLKTLDPAAAAFTFQTFDDNRDRKRKELTRILNGSLEKHAQELARLNADGAGIYVTVNQTDLRGRKNENIIRPRAIFQEADKPGGRLPPLAPHIVVESSPGKFHRYLLLKGGQEVGWLAWSAVMKRMVDDYDSDKNAKDRARVLRLPGFFHLKGEPFRVRLAEVSDHPRYEWQEILEAIPPIPSHTPFVRPPAPPRVTATESTSYGLAALRAECRQLAAMPPDSGRNAELNRIAFRFGQFVSGGELAEEEAEVELKHAARACGLDEKEILDTFRSGFEKGKLYPRSAPKQDKPHTAQETHSDEWSAPRTLEYKPRAVPIFDAKTMLPDALRAWVVDEASRMQSPVEFVTVAAIVTVGALVGTKCGIKPKRKDDWFEFPNLWGMACGTPSSKKTPSLKAGAGLFFRLAAEEDERFRREREDFEQLEKVGQIELAEMEKLLANAIRARVKGGEDTDEQAHVRQMKQVETRLLESAPTKRRYYTSDCTCAKLGDLLVNNPLGIMIFRDELGGLLSRLDHPDNAEERGFYLEGYGGKGGYPIDRIGRGELWVPNVCLSVLGGIQPDKLSLYMNHAFRQLGNDGLLQRFGLLVYPEPIKGPYTDRHPDRAARERAWNVFRTLNDFDPATWGAIPPTTFVSFVVSALTMKRRKSSLSGRTGCKTKSWTMKKIRILKSTSQNIRNLCLPWRSYSI